MNKLLLCLLTFVILFPFHAVMSRVYCTESESADIRYLPLISDPSNIYGGNPFIDNSVTTFYPLISRGKSANSNFIMDIVLAVVYKNQAVYTRIDRDDNDRPETNIYKTDYIALDRDPLFRVHFSYTVSGLKTDYDYFYQHNYSALPNDKTVYYYFSVEFQQADLDELYYSDSPVEITLESSLGSFNYAITNMDLLKKFLAPGRIAEKPFQGRKPALLKFQDDLKKLANRDIREAQIQKYFKTLGRKVESVYDCGMYYEFPDAGLMFIAGNNCNIERICFFSKYDKDLPYGLNLSDLFTDVEARLGPMIDWDYAYGNLWDGSDNKYFYRLRPKYLTMEFPGDVILYYQLVSGKPDFNRIAELTVGYNKHPQPPLPECAKSAIELSRFIGKNMNDPEFIKTLSELGGKPETTTDNIHIATGYGIDFWIDKDTGILKFIDFKSHHNDLDLYSYYSGVLPHGLLMIDTIQAVWKKLGAPDEHNEISNGIFFQHYKEGISVEYNIYYGEIPRIDSISLSKPLSE